MGHYRGEIEVSFRYTPQAADSLLHSKIWNLPALDLRRRLATLERRDAVIFITFVHSDAILVAVLGSCPRNSICSWNVAEGTLLHSIPLHLGLSLKVMGSPHHSFVIVLGSNPAKVYDVELGQHFDLETDARTAAFMPDGTAFVTRDPGDELRTWSLQPLLVARARKSDDRILALPEVAPELIATNLEGPQVGLTLPPLCMLMLTPLLHSLSPRTCPYRPTDG